MVRILGTLACVHVVLTHTDAYIYFAYMSALDKCLGMFKPDKDGFWVGQLVDMECLW